MANAQISPGNAHPPSPLCPPHLRPRLPDRYWTLKILDFSSGATASHAVSVRRARVLPAASFRFHLAVDTLAVRLTLPPVGCVEDLHLQVGAPCGRTKQKRAPVTDRRPLLVSVQTAYKPRYRWTPMSLWNSSGVGVCTAPGLLAQPKSAKREPWIWMSARVPPGPMTRVS